MAGIIHFTGSVLIAADQEVAEAWSVDGRLTFVRPHREADVTLDGWVLPGFVDAHCHIGLGPAGSVPEEVTEAQALADRDAGTLLIRDAGTVSDTRWVQQRPDLPRLVRAGRHVARSRRYLRDFAVEVEPEDLVETVRKQALAGDGWVKLVGDWIDRAAGDLTPAFPAAVVKDAIAAAHAEGARVTAHCFAEQTLDDMLDAGIDCIEHATGLLPHHLPRLVEQQVPIVPTLINIDTFPGIAARADAKYPVYAAHMRALWSRRHERVREAFDAGVRIFAGTDAGSTIAHGRIADEILELGRAGLPAAAALDAATWGARQWLGVDGLAEGASADVVLCDGDPRRDLERIRDLKHIVLRGNVIR